jgi:hypothetical protein
MGKLEGCGIPLTDLRDQWRLQQEAQLSLRARKSSLGSYTYVLTSIRCTGAPQERTRYPPNITRRS